MIGHPLGHSFSRAYFNEKFEREGIDAKYVNLDLSAISDFKDAIGTYPDLAGLNVTLPYKEAIMAHLDHLDPTARMVGAVNVVKVVTHETDGSKRSAGYNSDVKGFADTVRPLLRPDIKSALVLGSGGASKAVCHALSTLEIECRVVSRTPGEGMLAYEGLTEEVMGKHLLVVNATPLGMWPNTETYPAIPYRLLTREHVCYDLVYNPETTEFMRRSSLAGATVKNGLDMLRAQAQESWRIWNE